MAVECNLGTFINRALTGGTRVPRVKFGVPPNFVANGSTWILVAGLRVAPHPTVSGATPETTGRRPVPPVKSRANLVMNCPTCGTGRRFSVPEPAKA